RNRRGRPDLEVLEDRLPVSETIMTAWALAALPRTGVAAARGNVPPGRPAAGAVSWDRWAALEDWAADVLDPLAARSTARRDPAALDEVLSRHAAGLAGEPSGWLDGSADAGHTVGGPAGGAGGATGAVGTDTPRDDENALVRLAGIRA